MWSSPEARNALATRDLGVSLRAYRKLNRLSQERFAAVLGYDKTYVSMIETGRRARVGLPVPRTLLINEAAQARKFAEQIGGPMIYKPLSAPSVRAGNELRLILYTPPKWMAMCWTTLILHLPPTSSKSTYQKSTMYD